MFLLLKLVDGHTLFDYDVGLNEIIQILVRKPIVTTDSSSAADEQSETDEPQPPASLVTLNRPLLHLMARISL